MYVAGVDLQDFRALGFSSIRLRHPGDGLGEDLDNVTAIVGANGAGKSTLLKAIAATIQLAQFRGRDEFDLPRDDRLIDEMRAWPRIGGEGDLVAEVELRSAAPASERLRGNLGPVPALARLEVPRDRTQPSLQWTSHELDDDVDEVRVAAYSAHRELHTTEGPGGGSMDSLLHDSGELRSLSELVTSQRAERMIELVDAVLPHDIGAHLNDDHPGGIGFTQRGITLGADALSDGVRAHLAWVTDLLSRLDGTARLDEDPTEIYAVALVDEVDQRMHPQWKLEVIGRLTSTLPRVQFVVTAHSALLLSGLRSRNVVVVEPDLDDASDGGAMRAVSLANQQTYGRTADQLLTSPYFGLLSTRSARFRRELRDIRGRRDEGYESALEVLRRLADDVEERQR